MKPLMVLLSSFFIVLIAGKIIHGQYDLVFAARLAMSLMLVFTSIAHFAFPKGMAMMIPEFIPFKTGMLYGTGLIEIAAAIGIQISALRVLTGWLLIIFFILIIPVNIHAAMKKVNYQKATLDGNGLSYLWFRIPLQILFIAWVYFCIR